MARKRAKSGLGILLVGLVALYGCLRGTDDEPAVSPPPGSLQNPVPAAPPRDLPIKDAEIPPPVDPVTEPDKPPPDTPFSPTGENDPILPRSPPSETLYVDADRLNLRAGPGTEHPVMATLARGTRVVAYEARAGWRRIEASGSKGWAAAHYLAVEPPPSAAPPKTIEQKPQIPDRPVPTTIRPAPKRSAATDRAVCCKVCRNGKPCGNSCIARDRRCRKGPGCACAGY